jgi:hypothetical protein
MLSDQRWTSVSRAEKPGCLSAWESVRANASVRFFAALGRHVSPHGDGGLPQEGHAQ